MRRVAWCLAVIAGAATVALVALPETALRGSGADLSAGLWRASAAALSLVFALQATMVAAAPRRYAHLLPVLGTAALVGAFSSAAESWLGMLPALGAAILAVGLLLLYVALWLAEHPSDATRERDRAILRAVATTLVPPGGRIPLDAADPLVERAVVGAYRDSGPFGVVRLRLTLRLVDAASLCIAGAPFARAEVGARDLVLERLLAARLRRVQRPVEVLRETILSRFYADPRVQTAIGFDGVHLRTRLEQGPNAGAHATALLGTTAGEEARADGVAEHSGPAVLEERGSLLRLVRAGPLRP